MARPTKNNAEYFTHDADMRNDVKVKALRRRFSHTGYAVWCYLLESLTDMDFFEMDFDDIDVELLAADYDISPEQLTEIVDYCCRINLLQRSEDGKRLYSETHKRRFSGLLTKRERDRERLAAAIAKANRSENTSKTPCYDNSIGENTYSKVKKSKVKKSKVKESKVKKEIENKFSLSLENKSDEAVAERERILEIFYFEKNCVDYFGETQRFISHYEANGWCRKDSKVPVKDRVHLARGWIVEGATGRVDKNLLLWYRKIYDKVKSESPESARRLIREVEGIYTTTGDGEVLIATKGKGVVEIIENTLIRGRNELVYPNLKLSYQINRS